MAHSPVAVTSVGSGVVDPIASLVVPSYGGEHRLAVLFDALRAQRCAAAWEVIVVLDGVIDASESVVGAIDDLPVRLIRFTENRGRPAALNAGFAAAEGQVLIRCDDDLEPGPSYVADHMLAHRGRNPVGVVGLYRNRFGDTAYARTYGRRYDSSVRAGAYRGSLGDPRYFWAGNCSVSRPTYDRVGDYDERFRTYGWEDIDWGFRLAASGVPIVLDPRLETTHHAANVDAVTRLRRAYASGMARVRFDGKHGTTFAPAPASGVKAKLWGGFVRVGAARARPGSITDWGRRIDASLPRLPASVGFRLMAGAVDAAALAGYRQAHLDAGASGVHPESGAAVAAGQR